MDTMSSMWTLGARATRDELIDGQCDAGELSESFRDLAFMNRWFGGTAVVRSALHGIRARSILDIGCGVADIPIALRAESRKRGIAQTFTCLDANEELLRNAQVRSGDDPGITFVHGDGKRLPFDDDAFDVAMCNLALHHFAEDAAVALLREMRRVSRITPVVTDLKRSALSWLAAYSFSRVFARGRLTRHDAPLSARRAYTQAEALRLASRAGWKAPRVRSYRLIRMVLIDEPNV